MKRKLSALACLLLAAVLAGSCLAASVARPANGCVADMAGVLERGTVEHIVAQNQTLTNSTGAVIAVVTVDFLNGMDIDDYATDLFNDWGLGDAQAKNGLLILLAIGEDNYSILQGTGLQSALPTSTLGEYAGEYLEDDFAAGNYDAGVGKLFDAFYAWFEDYYAGASAPSGTGAPAAPDHPGTSAGEVSYLLGRFVAFTIIIFLVIAFLILMSRPRYGYNYYYGGYYHRPFFFWRRRRHYGPPAPPRPSGYRPHTGGARPHVSSSRPGGGSSRGGGFSRSGGASHRSSGSFRASGGRSGFGGGHSRGGGFSRR